jgi:heme o synthase
MQHLPTRAAESGAVATPLAPRAAWARWRDYLSLTKPRVISLLLLTTLAAMLLAAPGLPALGTILFTLLGGYLAAGGAGALNCCLDSDIDAAMARTRRRPLPAQRLARSQALVFGLVLSLASFLVFWLGTNLLAAVLAASGILFYVLVYTWWLKRRTPQNIVIGGAAGAIPPLVGWAAASASLSPHALLLFAIIFVWTPPHFWALALVRQEDYARAGVPMLPVVAGAGVARRQILAYSCVLVALSLAPTLLGYQGFLSGLAAALLGVWLLYHAVRLLRQPQPAVAWRLYRFSLLYLALLFASMAADKLLMAGLAG